MELGTGLGVIRLKISRTWSMSNMLVVPIWWNFCWTAKLVTTLPPTMWYPLKKPLDIYINDEAIYGDSNN